MKPGLAIALAALAWLAAAAAFVFSCFAAASDVQGAYVFFLLGPVTLLLFAVAHFTARLARTLRPVLSRAVSWASLGGLVFVVAFFVSAFVGPLSAFPEGVIDAVSAGYEAITGETPYAAAHRSEGAGKP